MPVTHRTADAGRGRDDGPAPERQARGRAEMETRMSGGDVSRSSRRPDDGRGELRPDRLPGRREHRADARDRGPPARPARHRRHRPGARRADAQPRIVESAGSRSTTTRPAGMTLHELAAEYGVSAERIRQIEVAAMKKMRRALSRCRRGLSPRGAGRAPARQPSARLLQVRRQRVRRRHAVAGEQAQRPWVDDTSPRCGPPCSCPRSCPAPS